MFRASYDDGAGKPEEEAGDEDGRCNQEDFRHITRNDNMPPFDFQLPFPVDEEERRRRMLTPGINPNAPTHPLIPPGINPNARRRPPFFEDAAPVRLPNIPGPRPLPPLSPSVPGGAPSGPMPGMPRPSAFPEIFASGGSPAPAAPLPPMPPMLPKQPSRYEEMEEAKDVYLKGTPGRFKSGLLAALRGGLQGLATGGGLGAGLGGAAAGGLFGAINPKGARAMEFEERVKPRIMERFAYEDADRAQQAAGEKARREAEMHKADIGLKESQAIKNRMPAIRPPLIVPEGGVAINATTGEPIYTAQPKPPTRDELTIEPSSGKSFEQIARDSYEARGGDAYVLSKLPAWMRQVIEKGTMMTEEVDAEGNLTGKLTEAPADSESIQTAQRALADAIKRQWEADLQYTSGDVRSRAMGARKGGSATRQPQGAKPTQGGSRRNAISVQEAAKLLQ